MGLPESIRRAKRIFRIFPDSSHWARAIGHVDQARNFHQQNTFSTGLEQARMTRPRHHLSATKPLKPHANLEDERCLGPVQGYGGHI
jgi:hypothetical protein